MPAFDHGVVTIIACPDAVAGATAMHHHGDHNALHQPCPYASVSAFGTLGSDQAPLLAPALFAPAIFIAGAAAWFEQRERRRRPPATGPPFPA
jgi:hypothetical protein